MSHGMRRVGYHGTAVGPRSSAVPGCKIPIGRRKIFIVINCVQERKGATAFHSRRALCRARHRYKGGKSR
jgi:hypothetical protein